MTENRKDRMIIPAAVGLGSTFLTLWFGIGLHRDPAAWFGAQTGDFKGLLALLLTIGVANYGLGYLCNAIHSGIFMLWRHERFVDFDRLASIFGVPTTKSYCRKSLRLLENEILGAFHLRLHSHAPPSLIDWCSRRNSAWYISRASLFAMIIGYGLALSIMSTSCSSAFQNVWLNTHRPLFIGISIFVLVVASIALWFQGDRWNREFWEVCWKWLEKDVKLKPLVDPGN